MKIKKARKVIRKAFKADPDFKRTYIDNVSMCLCDTFIDEKAVSGYRNDTDLRDKTTRDGLAEKIIDLIFGK